jgi:DNA (cytosine-5)-methyltransferase 1
MKILNLYAGLGGNRKHWDGDITAVENEPDIAKVYQDNFPGDKVIIADAHEYLLEHSHEFDFIWSSPPCQSHSRMIMGGRNRNPRFPDLKLYEEILYLKHQFEGVWVVENVVPYYEPLIPAKKIGRHLFWSNFRIGNFDTPKFENMMNRQNLESKKQMQEWLGIHYDENIYYKDNHCPTQILRNCVHPDLGLYIFNCASGIVNKKNVSQLSFL